MVYRNVFRSIPGLVCLLGADLTIVDANPEFIESQDGISVQGKDFCEFLPNLSDKAYFGHEFRQIKFSVNFDQMSFQTSSGSLSHVCHLFLFVENQAQLS